MNGVPLSRRIVAVLCALLSLAFVVACDSSEPLIGSTPVEAVKGLPLVTRVIDADTIVVRGTRTVRLIGVDTPEIVDPRRPA
jgi:endonuclease YncB( thermonuclease family)